jgi:subtilase family serine protease
MNDSLRFLSVLALTTSAALGAASQNGSNQPVQPDIEDVSGPPQAGCARPPLFVHLKPSLLTGYGYSPQQIRHAYGFDILKADGTGQTIALVNAYGNQNIQADLNAFCDAFPPLASTTVTILGNNAGGNGNGWDLETSLDVEWAHVIAPGAKILLSVADSNKIIDLLAAVDAAVAYGATVVSMSWGSFEFFGESILDSHFDIPGVVFTASSGDGGAGVEWPAVSDYVVGVGGTTLILDNSGNRILEIAWPGSGGGPSAIVPRPAFQNGWQATSGRGVPDVSYVADPFTGMPVYSSTYPGGPWLQVGGTSAGAPQWAALIALAKSSGPLTTGIYSLAKGPMVAGVYTINSTYFFDVSFGDNGIFNAGPRYDFVTGLGSPVANTLVPALVKPPSPVALGDFNQDGYVDRNDLATLVAAIRAHSNDPTYDLNQDGKVDVADVQFLVLHFTNPDEIPSWDRP